MSSMEAGVVPADSNAAVRPSPASSPTSAPPLPRFHIRYGGMSDIRALMQIYRGQSEASRALYHPFPFDRGRLALIYLWLVFARHLLPWGVKRLPRLAAVLFVLVPDGSRTPVGYATLRYVASPGEEIWGKMGYVIRPEYQRLGLGRVLAYWLFRAGIASGIRLGGGPVLSTNAANIGLWATLGIKAMPTDITDRGAGGAKNMIVLGDLLGPLQQMNAHGLDRGSSRAAVEFEGTPPDGPPPDAASGATRA